MSLHAAQLIELDGRVWYWTPVWGCYRHDHAGGTILATREDIERLQAGLAERDSDSSRPEVRELRHMAQVLRTGRMLAAAKLCAQRADELEGKP